MRVRSIEFELPEVILPERPKRISKLRRKIMNTMRSSPYGGIESKRKSRILREVTTGRCKKKKRMISNTIGGTSTHMITSGKYLKDLLLSSKQDNRLVHTWTREIDLRRLRMESSTPEGSALSLLREGREKKKSQKKVKIIYQHNCILSCVDSWSPLSHQKFKILNSNSDRQKKKNKERERNTFVLRGEEKIFEKRVTR